MRLLVKFLKDNENNRSLIDDMQSYFRLGCKPPEPPGHSASDGSGGGAGPSNPSAADTTGDPEHMQVDGDSQSSDNSERTVTNVLAQPNPTLTEAVFDKSTISELNMGAESIFKSKGSKHDAERALMVLIEELGSEIDAEADELESIANRDAERASLADEVVAQEAATYKFFVHCIALSEVETVDAQLVNEKLKEVSVDRIGAAEPPPELSKRALAYPEYYAYVAERLFLTEGGAHFEFPSPVKGFHEFYATRYESADSVDYGDYGIFGP